MATGNEKKFELKIGKTGLFIVVAGMTALLCAAFLFGIDVGQNIETYPEKITALPQRALALFWRPARIRMAQQNAPQSNSTVVQEPPAAAEKENVDLTYHQTLTSKKGLANTDAFKEKQQVVVAVKNEEDAQKGKFHIETQNQVVTQNEAATPKETVKEKESPKQKETVKQKEVPKMETNAEELQPVKHKFIVQVASLKDKSKAYQINKKIDSLGFKSKIIKAEIKGKGIMYRVVASDLNDKEQAQQAAKKISAKTGTNCIVKKIDSNISEN
jgi:cell division septation protein DedD